MGEAADVSAGRFENRYSDRMLTLLQEDGTVTLTDGATLAELLGLVQELGIDPRDVVVSQGGFRQLRLRVIP